MLGSNHFVLMLPSALSPFDSLFVQQLIEYLDSRLLPQKKGTLIVIAEGNLNDGALVETMTVGPLNSSEFFLAKMRLLSKTLHRIASVNTSTVWVSSGECTGLWWEIASAFTSRIWFGESNNVGFPEVRYGEISPLGLFAKVCARNPNLVDLISTEPVICVEAAMRAGWVDAVFPATGKVEIANLIELFESLPGGKASDLNQSLINANGKRPILRWQEITPSRREDRAEESRVGGSLQILRELVRAKEPGSLNRNVENILMPLRIRELLGKPGRLVGPRVGISTQTAAENCKINFLQVRASGILPPTTSLIRLIRSRMNLVLFEQNPTAIVRSSEVLDARLQKFITEEEIKSFREERLVLIQSDRGVRVSPGMLEVEWGIDERITAFSRDGDFFGMALEGNDNAAPLGPVEVGSEIGFRANDLVALRMLYESVISTEWLMSGNLPISVWVRCVSIQMMWKICAQLGCGVHQMISGLKLGGWRFLGDENRILRFLRYRAESFVEFDSSTQISGLRPDVLLLSQFLEATQKKASASGQIDRSDLGSEINLAAKVIAATIFVTLSEVGPMADRNGVDQLVSASVGFPTNGRSAQSFLREFGPKRTLAYANSVFDLPELTPLFLKYVT